MYHLRLKGDYYQMGVKKEETYFKKLYFLSTPVGCFSIGTRKKSRSEEILRQVFPRDM